MKISKRASNVSASTTLAITATANELKKRGVDVVAFSAGEPDFNTPQYIIDEANIALSKGFTKYTASRGMPELRSQICNKFLADNNLSYKPNQIIVSNGAKQSLFNILQVLVDEGDEVIIPSPYWLTYPELVNICGGTCVYIQTSESNNLKITPKQLREAITPKTKVFMFNSPSNPSGIVYSKKEIEALAKVLGEFPDIWVVSDEIYEKLIYDGSVHYSIAQVNEDMFMRTIVINGLSKSHAMTGWRIGYAACGNADIIEYMDNLQSHETSNANSIAQYASVAALKGGKEFFAEMVATFKARRDKLNSLLKEIDGISIIEGEGAFYTLVDISKLFGRKYKGLVLDSAATVAQILISDYAVAVIPCEAFGTDKYIRLTYTLAMDRIIEGVNRISQFVQQVA